MRCDDSDITITMTRQRLGDTKGYKYTSKALLSEHETQTLNSRAALRIHFSNIDSSISCSDIYLFGQVTKTAYKSQLGKHLGNNPIIELKCTKGQ